MFPIKDTIPRKHPSVALWIVILLNAATFYFELSLSPADLEKLFYVFGLVPARYTHPHWAAAVGLPSEGYLPFVTSMFLHGGWLHLILNMWTLWIFGDNIEDRMGSVRFVIFYLICGIVSLMAHFWSNPASQIPAIGASGAVAGILGAYLFMFPQSRIIAVVPIFFYPLFVEIPAFFYLSLWFLVQLGSSAMTSSMEASASGGVAWWAHIGGFVVGMLIWPLFLAPSRRRRKVRIEDTGMEDWRR